MHRLNLLGAAALVDADGRHASYDVAPKHLAVLVFLVTEAAERPVRRDVVATQFWPDSEQRNARQSLSQALHALRDALGDVVVSKGQEELRLDRAQIGCDCFDFHERARQGRLEEAVALVHGEFAHGLSVRDAPEFDEWLAAQRHTWRENVGAVVTKLFDAAVRAEKWTDAARWAGKLLDIAPEHDQPVRRIIPLLAQSGHGAAAIKLYERYTVVLHETFGVTPDAELAALIVELRKRQSSAVVMRKSFVAEPIATPRRAWIRWSGVAALVLVLLAVARFFTFAPAKVLATSPPKVAVTQFASAGPSKSAAVVLNDALQWRLQAAGFSVLNAGAPDTAALRRSASHEAGNSFVIGGDVEPGSSGVIVAKLWLRDAATGERVWEGEFSEEAANAHRIVDELSESVAAQIRRVAGQVVEASHSAQGVSAEAWGEVYRARERIEAANDMANSGAVSGSAAELAEAEATLVDVANAEPQWDLPWRLRARLAMIRGTSAIVQRDLPAGAAALDRGIRMLDSVAARLNSPDVYEMSGRLLFRRWAFGVDGVAEAKRLLERAEAQLRQAIGLGYERSSSYTQMSAVMQAEGKWAEALVYARRAYDSNIFLRNNEQIVSDLFNSALNAGDDAAANQWCQELQQLQQGKWPAVLCRIHLAGFAPKLVDVEPLQNDIDQLVGPPPVRQLMQPLLRAAYAVSLAQLGMKDSARATLRRLENEQNPEVIKFRAMAFAQLKDAGQAHVLLRKYLSQDGGTRSSVLHQRWLNQSQSQTPLTY